VSTTPLKKIRSGEKGKGEAIQLPTFIGIPTNEERADFLVKIRKNYGL